MSEKSDIEIVRDIKNGSVSAFQELYSRYADIVYRNILARVNSSFDADDIFQDFFIQVWEKRDASYIDSDKNGSKWMREQVLEARKRQQMRCRGAAMRENGRLSPGEILKYCPLGLEEQEFLEQASEQAGLSMRGCHRVIRVARTIADLEGKDRIGVEHLGQALFFRNQNVLRE